MLVLSRWPSNLKRFYRYKVREVFAGGGSALVEWRLETGRTHQVIRPPTISQFFKKGCTNP